MCPDSDPVGRPEKSTAFAKVMDDLPSGERDLTIVFTDIAGFSRKIEQIEKEQGLHEAVLIKEVHDSILRNVLGAEYLYVKSLGDGCLFLYTGECAPLQPLVTTQLAFKNITNLKVRIGVHTGKVWVHSGSPLDKWKMSDPLGHNVNVAHRVMEIAPPGAIYLTKLVHDRCKHALPSTANLTPLGHRSLPKLKEKVEVWELKPAFANAEEATGHLRRALPWLLSPPIAAVVEVIRHWPDIASGFNKVKELFSSRSKEPPDRR